MNVDVNPAHASQTVEVLNKLTQAEREQVGGVIQILEQSESLQEASQILMDDMAIDGKDFSISIRRNAQFVVGSVVGEGTGNMLLIQVVGYE